MNIEDVKFIINLYLDNYKSSKAIISMFEELKNEIDKNPRIIHSQKFFEKFIKYQTDANDILMTAFSMLELQNPERFVQLMETPDDYELPEVSVQIDEEDIEAAEILEGMKKRRRDDEETSEKKLRK